jgi:hypothetical protein
VAASEGRSTPHNSCKAEEARTKQRKRGGLGHLLRQFSDDDLAVAGLEIGDQDLLCASIKGAAAATSPVDEVSR